MNTLKDNPEALWALLKHSSEIKDLRMSGDIIRDLEEIERRKTKRIYENATPRPNNNNKRTQETKPAKI